MTQTLASMFRRQGTATPPEQPANSEKLAGLFRRAGSSPASPARTQPIADAARAAVLAETQLAIANAKIADLESQLAAEQTKHAELAARFAVRESLEQPPGPGNQFSDLFRQRSYVVRWMP